jgi:hypothetical protein
LLKFGGALFGRRKKEEFEMAKVTEMAEQKTPKYRAPPVAEKLAAAEAHLQDLEGHIAQVALDEAEGVSGASERMQELNAQISAARAERHKLRSAHRLAVDIDRRNEVQARTKIRSSQLSAMLAYARQRDAAVVEIFEAAKTMAAAYSKYSSATLQMVGVKPIGTQFPMMAMGPNGLCGSVIGDLERLISVELLRCSSVNSNGQRFAVPFAKPLDLSHRDDPEAIPPALDMFRTAQEAIIAEIKGQCDQAEANDLAVTTKTTAVLQEAI